MSFASRGLRVFLSVLLLFSQQQAVVHLLGHGMSQIAERDAGDHPPEALCAKCLAIAHLDHAVAGEVRALEAVSARPVFDALVPAAVVDLAFLARYRSRAPPVFS